MCVSERNTMAATAATPRSATDNQAVAAQRKEAQVRLREEAAAIGEPVSTNTAATVHVLETARHKERSRDLFRPAHPDEFCCVWKKCMHCLAVNATSLTEELMQQLDSTVTAGLEQLAARLNQKIPNFQDRCHELLDHPSVKAVWLEAPHKRDALVFGVWLDRFQILAAPSFCTCGSAQEAVAATTETSSTNAIAATPFSPASLQEKEQQRPIKVKCEELREALAKKRDILEKKTKQQQDMEAQTVQLLDLVVKRHREIVRKVAQVSVNDKSSSTSTKQRSAKNSVAATHAKAATHAVAATHAKAATNRAAAERVSREGQAEKDHKQSKKDLSRRVVGDDGRGDEPLLLLLQKDTEEEKEEGEKEEGEREEDEGGGAQQVKEIRSSSAGVDCGWKVFSEERRRRAICEAISDVRRRCRRLAVLAACLTDSHSLNSDSYYYAAATASTPVAETDFFAKSTAVDLPRKQRKQRETREVENQAAFVVRRRRRQQGETAAVAAVGGGGGDEEEEEPRVKGTAFQAAVESSRLRKQLRKAEGASLLVRKEEGELESRGSPFVFLSKAAKNQASRLQKSASSKEPPAVASIAQRKREKCGLARQLETREKALKRAHVDAAADERRLPWRLLLRPQKRGEEKEADEKAEEEQAVSAADLDDEVVVVEKKKERNKQWLPALSTDDDEEEALRGQRSSPCLWTTTSGKNNSVAAVRGSVDSPLWGRSQPRKKKQELRFSRRTDTGERSSLSAKAAEAETAAGDLQFDSTLQQKPTQQRRCASSNDSNHAEEQATNRCSPLVAAAQQLLLRKKRKNNISSNSSSSSSGGRRRRRKRSSRSNSSTSRRSQRGQSLGDRRSVHRLSSSSLENFFGSTRKRRGVVWGRRKTHRRQRQRRGEAWEELVDTLPEEDAALVEGKNVQRKRSLSGSVKGAEEEVDEFQSVSSDGNSPLPSGPQTARYGDRDLLQKQS